MKNKFNSPLTALAWALFRADEPDNLGVPDSREWANLFLPRAAEILAECAANGFELSRKSACD